MINERGQRLELDFYIEETQSAIEVQGAQHYTYVEAFHGDYSGFIQQLSRDDDKRRICDELGIKLFEVSDENSAIDAIANIIEMIPPEDNTLSKWTSFKPIDKKKSHKNTIFTKKIKNNRTVAHQLDKTKENLDKELAKDRPNQERIDRLKSSLEHCPKKYEGKIVHRDNGS